MERLEVGENVDSDHHPLIVWVRGKLEREQRKREGERIRRRGLWSEEGRTQFKERLGMIERGKGELQEEIEVGIARIRKEENVIENENEGGRMVNKGRRG